AGFHKQFPVLETGIIFHDRRSIPENLPCSGTTESKANNTRQRPETHSERFPAHTPEKKYIPVQKPAGRDKKAEKKPFCSPLSSAQKTGSERKGQPEEDSPFPIPPFPKARNLPESKMIQPDNSRFSFLSSILPGRPGQI